MKRIQWLISGSAPSWKENNYQDGGYVYDTTVRKILKEQFDLSVSYFSRGQSSAHLIKSIQFFRYYLSSKRLKTTGDLVVRDPFSTVFSAINRNCRNLVILHHFDKSIIGHKRFYEYFERAFYKNLSLCDKVIVVSEYWRDIIEKQSGINPEVIYNSFDLKDFHFTEMELTSFRQSLSLPKDKPIIYLGNARPEKGYRDAYSALNGLDAFFVTTGRFKVDIPVQNAFLSYRDYLKLLTVSDLVLTMSTFDEGWCRTAHEAMLCGTPVIGSGKGGMGELLHKGGQVICPNFEKLYSITSSVIDDREKLLELGLSGKNYASNFDMDYFRNKWLQTISSLLST